MRDKVVQKHFDQFQAALQEDWPEIISFYELDKEVPEEAPSDEIFDGLTQKALAGLLKQKLDAEPALNQRFKATTPVALWNQLLMGARVKELARAKIVKKGGRKQLRYDVADLAKTFFGKVLLSDAGLQRQKVLDKEELAKLQKSCAKVKLTLPESVEPTTTERFFDPKDEA
jgi:hypothetical protein